MYYDKRLHYIILKIELVMTFYFQNFKFDFTSVID
jgi:hypothetical protein